MSRLNPTVRGALRKSDVREANERFIMNLIRQSPRISRSDLVRITGFAPSTMTFIVSRLIRSGLVGEARVAGAGQLGRRPVGLCLKPEALVVMGVELRDSGAVIVSADFHGTVLESRTMPRHPDPNIFLARVRDAIRRMAGRRSRQRLAGIGVSLAGAIDRATGRVIADENNGWFDVEAGLAARGRARRHAVPMGDVQRVQSGELQQPAHQYPGRLLRSRDQGGIRQVDAVRPRLDY